jgi:RHS repeat-associated protein
VTGVGTGGDPLPGGKTTFTRAADGSLVSQLKPDGTKEYFILDGHPGSVVALVDTSSSKTVATGMVKARYRYDPYGNLTLQNGTSDTPWRFAGAWFDRFPGPATPASAQKGLYKMGERYYDPRTGRWTQRDPIDQSDDLRGANRYSYSGDEPVNAADPSGLAYSNDSWGCTAGSYFGCSWGRQDNRTGFSARQASAVVQYGYNFASGCLAGSELGGAAGFFVAAPEVGAVAGCVGGGIAGEFLPTQPYEGNGYPRFAK